LVLRPGYPHFLHLVALGGFLVEQFMQIVFSSNLFVASGKGIVSA
jgi:hypothetical protein